MTEIFDITQADTPDADAYHTLRGNSTWTGTDELKSQALTRAWDYLSGLRWRPGVFDDLTISGDMTYGERAQADVKSAQIVGALRELVSPGVLLPDLTAGDFLKSKDIAGAIKQTFRDNAPAGTVVSELNALIGKYLMSGFAFEKGRG